MERYTDTLHNLNWCELLEQVSAILAKDTKSLESNVNYYKKLFNNGNASKEQLNRLFEKLQLDKLRYACFSELFFRLDENRYKFMIMSLESCISQETEIQNRAPKDWVVTVTYENGQIRVYFMALSYYQ